MSKSVGKASTGKRSPTRGGRRPPEERSPAGVRKTGRKSAPMLIFNTLSRGKEPFAPAEAGPVKIYTCGPTVYRYAHIGNMRAYLLADWLRRFLEAQGYRVTQVKNITDVGHMRQEMLERGEDKVI